MFQQIVYLAQLARNSFCATGYEQKLDIEKEEIYRRVEQAKEALLRADDLERKEVKFIRWERPSNGWWKMNVDEAASCASGRAGAGDILRDSQGRWKAYFTVSTRLINNMTADLWGILKGIEMAWNSGERRVILETDSKAALELVQGAGPDSLLSNLIHQIRNYTRRDQKCSLQHVWREGNKCADWLAKQSVSSDLGMRILTELLQELRELIGADILGVATPRFVTA